MKVDATTKITLRTSKACIGVQVENLHYNFGENNGTCDGFLDFA